MLFVIAYIFISNDKILPNLIFLKSCLFFSLFVSIFNSLFSIIENMTNLIRKFLICVVKNK